MFVPDETTVPKGALHTEDVDAPRLLAHAALRALDMIRVGRMIIKVLHHHLAHEGDPILLDSRNVSENLGSGSSVGRLERHVVIAEDEA